MNGSIIGSSSPCVRGGLLTLSHLQDSYCTGCPASFLPLCNVGQLFEIPGPDAVVNKGAAFGRRGMNLRFFALVE